MREPKIGFSKSSDAPLLSIVIVSWNTRDTLADCLTSIFQHTQMLNFEVIVVDNASADRTVEMLKSDFPQVKVITNDSNRGFGRACNQGMQASEGRLILLFNSDAFVRDDVIVGMADYMQSRSEVSMASCQLQYPDGRIQHCAYRSLSIWRSLFEDFWVYKLVPSSTRDEILLGGYWKNDREIEVDWLAGAFMMLRREVFEGTGGFSEDFFMYGEDSEWCTRIRRTGRKIFYNPLGVVYHVGSVSSDLEWTEKERLRRCHLGGLRAYAKLNGSLRGFFYHLARFAGALMRFAVYSTIAAFTTGNYYGAQRRLYAWQTAFYWQAFAPESSACFMEPVTED